MDLVVVGRNLAVNGLAVNKDQFPILWIFEWRGFKVKKIHTFTKYFQRDLEPSLAP